MNVHEKPRTAAVREVHCGVRLVLCLCWPLLLAACLSRYAKEPFRQLSLEGMPDSEMARLELDSAEWMEVDGGERSDDEGKLYREFLVLPGQHRIRWGREFGVSFLVDPRMVAPHEHSAIAHLESGHVYTVHMERTYGPGYVVYAWLNDETAGRVLTDD